MLLFSPCLGGGDRSADLLSSYHLNRRKEFCEKRFNMDIHYHYYNCLYRAQTPWAFCASEAASLQASSNAPHKGAGRKSEDPVTLAPYSLRGSSHSGVKVLGAGLDLRGPLVLAWLHTLLCVGSYRARGSERSLCVGICDIWGTMQRHKDAEAERRPSRVQGSVIFTICSPANSFFSRLRREK